MHWYRYIVCRVPVTTSAPLRFGTLFHSALEQWWLAYQLVASERLEVALGVLAHADDDEERVVAEELLRAYHLRWHEEPLVTETVEQEFHVPLVNPDTGRSSRTFTLSGKIDAKVFDPRTQRRYLVEHKTTTQEISEGSSYWQKLRMDGQVSTYYDAFPDVAGCIYDVIRRPLQRRLKATPVESRKYTTKGALFAQQRAEDETLDAFRARLRDVIADNPDAYLKRGIVVRLADEMREHQLDVWHQANVMRELQNANLHPRNPDSCIQFNRTCDYFAVCTGEASIDNDHLFQIRAQHPELAQQEAP